ncbi:MAG: DEAD/DEAH box helicase [Planctomycetota bacterium]
MNTANDDDTHGDGNHAAFDLLAPAIQRALFDMRWESLRSIQVDAIHTVLQSDRDLLISAATAGGKTEAAFLPVLSHLATQCPASIGAIYVGPLKALINDERECPRDGTTDPAAETDR